MSVSGTFRRVSNNLLRPPPDLLDYLFAKVFSAIWKRSLKRVGHGFHVGRGALIQGGECISIGKGFFAGQSLWIEAVREYAGERFAPSIEIGDGVQCSQSVHLTTNARLIIGDGVLFGSRVHVTDHSHGNYRGDDQDTPDLPPAKRRLPPGRPVTIGANVWLGDGVVVLPGVTIGNGSIVGANSVVSRDLPAHVIAVGAPAVPIKRYDAASGRWTPPGACHMTTLGICIPTYRRPEFLRRCVLSAIASANGCSLRIFIADDSVSDVNAAVLDELTADNTCISAFRNANNLGIDANIQRAVDLCDCDYAWLIGEDDEFLPGAVAEMHEFLQGRDDPFVFSSYQYVSEDHSRVLGVVQGSPDEAVEQTDDFVEKQLWSIGFIGAVVVNRREWLNTVSAPYLGTYFTHVGRIVDMLASTEHVARRNRPAVANRAQGDDTFTWKKDAFGVFLGFERMCEIAAIRNPGLAEHLRKAAVNYRNKFAYFSLKTTFRLRSEGAFDLRQFRVYVAPSKTIEGWRKLWLLWLAVTPAKALKPLAIAYNLRRSRRAR